MTPEEIEPRVSEALRLMQLEINDMNWRPRSNADCVFLMLLSKALRTGLAVCELVKSGFYGEAFGLARSLLETYFTIKYIAKPSKTEERAASYIAFGGAHIYNVEMLRREYFPTIPPPPYVTQTYLDETKRKWGDKPRNWTPAYSMAFDYYDHPAEIDPKTGKGFQAKGEYDGHYEETSQYVHARIAAIHITHQALVGRVFKMAEVDKEEIKGFYSLLFAMGYSYQCYTMVARNWDQGPSRVRLDALYTELRTFINTASGGEVFWKV